MKWSIYFGLKYIEMEGNFEALDLVINAIQDRFDQPGYKMCKNLQEILLKAANGHDYSTEIQTVTDFYGDDFDPVQLRTQLQLLTQRFGSVGNDKIGFKEIVAYIQSLSTAQCTLFSQVVILVSLV